MPSRGLFEKGLRRLCVVFLNYGEGQAVGATMLDVYEDALRDLTDDEWRRAVRWAERNCDFMPRPGELRRAIGRETTDYAEPPPQSVPDPLVHGVPLPEYIEAAQGGEMPDTAQDRLMGGQKPKLPAARAKLRRPPKMKEMP